MGFFLQIAKVFAFAFMIDVMWVFYILAASQKRKITASIVSMFMGAPAIFGYIEIIENKTMAIPFLLGLGCGTMFGMFLHDRISNEK